MVKLICLINIYKLFDYLLNYLTRIDSVKRRGSRPIHAPLLIV